MKFYETMEYFLQERNEGKFYDSSVITYKRKLEVFFEFLVSYYGVNDNNYSDLLRSLGSDKILNSIKYYVNEYDIKFKVTVDNYFTVIKVYFDFIADKYNIKNNMFDSTQEFTVLKNSVAMLIDDLKLDKSKQKSPIVDTIFDNLSKYCNEKIDTLSKEEIIGNQIVSINDYNKTLVEFISAIIIKIVMLTGIKNQVIGTIRLGDLDTELNRIKINNYWIHLPNDLGRQIKKYADVRNELVKTDSKEYPLFVNKQGEPIGTDYNFMFDVLKPITGSKKAECVAKYTIINMIRKGINSSIIQEFTSFGNDTYLHCQELVNEEKSKIDLKNKNRYLDSKIRSIEIFDTL
jgi:integrase